MYVHADAQCKVRYRTFRARACVSDVWSKVPTWPVVGEGKERVE